MGAHAMANRSMPARAAGRGCAAVALAAALLAVAPAHAADDTLDRAHRLYRQARYRAAYQLYRDALAQQGNRRPQLVDIYLHLGVLAAALDRDDEALDHFLRALSLEPRAELASNVSAATRRQFAAARSRARGLQRFALRQTAAARLTGTGVLEVATELVPDSLGMATALTLRYRPVGRQMWSEVNRSGNGPILFSVPAADLLPGREVEFYLWVRDPYGGILHELGTERAPLFARLAAVASSQPSEPAPSAADNVDSAPLPLAAPGADLNAGAATASSDDEAMALPAWIWFAAGAGGLVLVAGAAAAITIAIVVRSMAGADFEPIRTEVAPLR